MIPNSQYAKLYLYSDLNGAIAWARDPQDFRDLTRSTKQPMRAVSRAVPIPSGYKRIGKGLANDGIRRSSTNANASFFAGLKKIGWA